MSPPPEDAEDDWTVVDADETASVDSFEGDAEHIRAPSEWPTLPHEWEHCLEYEQREGSSTPTATFSYAAAAAVGLRANAAARPRPVAPPSHQSSAVKDEDRRQRARTKPRRERGHEARWSEVSFHSTC